MEQNKKEAGMSQVDRHASDSYFLGKNHLNAMGRKLLFANIIEIFDSLVAQMVKSLPSMWETRVRSLGWDDPLEKEMAIHSSIPVWEIP